ncbi:MAG: hypothetical protein MRY21_08580 [Simkaniaceae bacterium]|nr:hypothetical protein [Simkaniaceae bacterium]
MKGVLSIGLLALVLFGCHIPSSVALRGAGGRNSYNVTLQQTGKEQMLLNLIRLRYCDTPYFLQVSGITTQFSFDAGIRSLFPIPGANEKNPVEPSGNLGWRNQPTISYSPLEGKSFAEHLLKPLDLILIQHLIYSGWDIDRIFRLIIQSIDNAQNAPTAAGPLPNLKPEYKRFYQITELMRQLQIQGKLQVGVTTQEADKCKKGTSLQILFSSSTPQGEELANILNGVRKSKGDYVLNTNLGFDEDGEIGVMPRSVLSCMYYLSLGVKVPRSHARMVSDMETTPQARIDWNDIVGQLMTVSSCSRVPANAYVKVRYKDHWFYIDDEDVNSKRTFSLLMGLYNLQAGGTTIEQTPILSIPLL